MWDVGHINLLFSSLPLMYIIPVYWWNVWGLQCQCPPTLPWCTEAHCEQWPVLSEWRERCDGWWWWCMGQCFEWTILSASSQCLVSSHRHTSPERRCGSGCGVQWLASKLICLYFICIMLWLNDYFRCVHVFSLLCNLLITSTFYIQGHQRIL